MRKQERGYVLVSVILAVSLVLLTLLVASTYTQLTSRVLTLQLNYQGQALNTAQAGLSEGADWFRRQTVQPVTAFTPTINTAAVPPINDTDVVTGPPDGTDPKKCYSIQRDFLISSPGNIWGHYEVWQGPGPSPANKCTGGVMDLSSNRRGPNSAAGVIWQLESTGTVYVRNDPNLATPYNQSPNQVLATKVVRSEISKIAINLPDTAAISINSGGGSVSIGTSDNSARVVGGTASNHVGVSSTNGATPNVGGGATLSGNPSVRTVGSAAFTLNNVFSVTSPNDLAAMADYSVSSVSALPYITPPAPALPYLPAMQIIIINGNANFTSTYPLNGSGILVVYGNVSIASSPNLSTWNGLIYCTGNFAETGPATINGSVIVATSGKTAAVQGSGDFAEIYYDPFIISQMNQQLSQYRFSRSGYVPCPSWDTNCNSKFAGGS
ncbi:MAG TPA: hypothetical protein VLV86_20305 [Vicinamibacterales bacterium]|nr:hypothetical protein [Vicinamibacterales bacterium]